jgi:hypothetical protein
MSGIQMALLGSASAAVYQLTAGSATLPGKATIYLYGYSNASATSGYTPSTFGSITPANFKGFAVKAIYSSSFIAGQANSYQVIFAGDRTTPAGFFNTLTVNTTLVTGTLSSSYSSTNNETTFTITLGSSAATLLSSNCTVTLT